MARAKKASEPDTQPIDWGKNYATDDKVCTRFIEFISKDLVTARTNRLTLEQQWLDDLRLWSCIGDEQGYKGMSNLFVPELNNQVETTVENNWGAVFATPDFVNCIPMQTTNRENALKIQAAVRYELEERSKIGQLYEKHLRSKVLFGTGIVRGGFKKEYMTIYVKDEKGRPIAKEVPKKFGTCWDSVDLFRWYIYPETADIESARFVFEDSMMNLGEAKRAKRYVNLDDIVSGIRDGFDHQWVDQERMDLSNLSNALQRYDNTALFTEIFCEFPLSGPDGDYIPVQVTLANNATVVRIIRNPFWFQHAPYAGSKYLERPGGMAYGMSLSDKIRSQQYQMNDLTNQTMDGLNFTLNPIRIIDPSLAGDVNSFITRPGATWVGSPEGIQTISFPDVSQAGLRAMQEIRGQIAQFSDNTPGVAPQLQGKSRTAYQASVVNSAVTRRQKMQAKQEEADVLVPMCKMTHIMLQQFMDKAWQIRRQGPDQGEWMVETVRPQDLVGDVDWIWKGQSAVEKTAVYSQQLIAFFNEAVKVATILPGEVDLSGLFIKVAKEGFQLNDLDQYFKTLRQKKTVSPDSENLALLEEQDIDINYGDDDNDHIERHQEVLDNPDASKEAKIAAYRHIEKHEVQKNGKEAVKQLQTRIQALQQANQFAGSQSGEGPQAPGGAPQSPPGQDGRMGPAQPSVMEGNQSQVPSSLSSVMTMSGAQ